MGSFLCPCCGHRQAQLAGAHSDLQERVLYFFLAFKKKKKKEKKKKYVDGYQCLVLLILKIIFLKKKVFMRTETRGSIHYPEGLPWPPEPMLGDSEQ